VLHYVICVQTPAGQAIRSIGKVGAVVLSDARRVYASDPQPAKSDGEWECLHVSSGSLPCWNM
jgi:hypothetical protein